MRRSGWQPGCVAVPAAGARSWLNLQAAYDLRVAEIDNAKRIEREIAPATP